MDFAYAQDVRTDQKLKEDFDFGKEYERKVFDQLLCKKFLVNDDKFRTLSPYAPDCFIQYKGVWYPVEIKYSQKELTYVELKKNQADYLAEINGLYLQSTPTKYTLLDCRDIINRCMVVTGYCNKPCYRYSTPMWNTWNKPI